MAHMTDYLESALGGHVLTNTAMASPTTVYLALFETNPGETGDQTGEVSGGSYVRKAITFSEDGSVPGRFTNAALDFPDMPAASIVAIGVIDADAAGNMLYYRDFPAISVTAGDTYFVAADAITIDHD